MVSPRPNVRQADYRPWHKANNWRLTGSAGRAAATPGLVEGRDFDWHDRTYTWRCRCGETWQCRHKTISSAWARHHGTGVVRVVLGRDL